MLVFESIITGKCLCTVYKVITGNKWITPKFQCKIDVQVLRKFNIAIILFILRVYLRTS